MKAEHLTVALVALATVAYPGTATSSPLENRYVNSGNRASRGATDFHRENPAGAMRKLPNNGETQERVKRAFAPWNGEHSEYKTFTTYSVWKPPIYQLSRPYYIPVYGSPGRIPIYFAPQPFDYDPSVYTPDNKPPFVGPPYLPPVPPTTEAPPETTMTVKSRFDFDDDDDDRPVWDHNNINNNFDKESPNVPTRPPPPPQGFPQFPPLVHDAQNTGSVHLSAQDEDIINEVFNNRRTTEAPPRTQAPPRPTTSRTTSQSRPPQNPTQGPSGPSNCVWAVVSCCSAATNVYPERCFEQRGCPGPFWGSSPCDTEFAKAAVNAALNYYNQK